MVRFIEARDQAFDQRGAVIGGVIVAPDVTEFRLKLTSRATPYLNR